MEGAALHVPQKHIEPKVRPDTLTIPELEQSKAARP
jgi:hypothetical protein